MSKSKKIQLPDDREKALLQIADCIDEIVAARRVPSGADTRSFTGFLVPLELMHRLHGYGVEARRVAGHSSS